MEPKTFRLIWRDDYYLVSEPNIDTCDVVRIDDPAIVSALAIDHAAREAGLVDEHGNLRKIIGTLPMTKDGCVIGQEASVWFFDDDGRLTSALTAAVEANNDDDRYHLFGHDCYSTSEAAERAAGGGA
jgi:hypothetical protein